MLAPSTAEIAQRDAVVGRVRQSLADGSRIMLPAPEYGGEIGPFRYQFESEDDLLHLSVERMDGAELSPEDGQAVVRFLLPEVTPGMVWLKPGRFSQHFYFGAF